MIYEYWLAGIKEITDLKKQKLREVYGSGKAIYYIEETQKNGGVFIALFLLLPKNSAKQALRRHYILCYHFIVSGIYSGVWRRILPQKV